MIKAIMAVDSKMGIGKNGTLPWPANKEDLRHFKNQTDGHIVVMGSNTWKDPCFPAPLKNRENYVITSKPDDFDSVEVLGSNFKDKLIELDRNSDKDVWIIGGSTIITQCSELIEEFQLTVIPGDFNCDVFLNFPFGHYDITLSWIGEESKNEYFVYRRKH
jgi:dihydrofolate reductase